MAFSVCLYDEYSPASRSLCVDPKKSASREKPENISLIFIFNIPVYPVSNENKQIRISQLSLKHSRDCLSKDTSSLTEIL